MRAWARPDRRRHRSCTSSALIAALAVLIATPTVAQAATCPDATVKGVRVIELTDELGCEQGARLASRTVRNDGYLQTDAYYCRWGHGGRGRSSATLDRVASLDASQRAIQWPRRSHHTAMRHEDHLWLGGGCLRVRGSARRSALRPCAS